MWVRTQDRNHLVNITGFHADGKIILGTQSSDDEGIVLGHYSTHEDALRVLHAIEQRIMLTSKTDAIIKGVRRSGETVYIMPEAKDNKKSTIK